MAKNKADYVPMKQRPKVYPLAEMPPPPEPKPETPIATEPEAAEGTGPAEGENAATFDWEAPEAAAAFEDPAQSVYNEWLKSQPEAAQRNQESRTASRGYDETYWADPGHVARWHNAIKATPVGAQLPEWLTPDFQKYIEETYKYMEFRNGGKPWTEWQWLNKADQALPLLAGLPTPPREFLYPEEVEQYAGGPEGPPQQGPTIENVMAGEAAWGDLPEEQRAAILKAPNFDLVQYDPMVRQQMLSDPNFDWEAVPAWQRTLFKLQSNPIVGGAVQGLFMGGLKGAVIGSVIGKSAETIGYNPNRWFYEQETGSKLGNVGATLMGLLNDLGQLTEVAVGYTGEVLDAALAGRGDVAAQMITDPVQREAALRAARVFYETSPLSTLATNAAIGIGNIFSKEDQRFLKSNEQMILGSNQVVTVPENYALEAMQEMRKAIAAEIEAGGDVQAVTDKYVYQFSQYAGAPAADLAMQAGVDPLNVLPGMSARVEAKALGGSLSKVGETIGMPKLGDTLGTAKSPTEVVNTLKAVVSGLPAEKVGELPPFTRWLAGVNEKGETTAGFLGLYPHSETMTHTEINPTEKVGLLGVGAKSLDSWARHIFTLAPEARARLATSMAVNNLGTMGMHLTPDEFGSVVASLQNMDLTAARNIAGEVAGSAEMYTVLPMLKGWDFGEIKTVMWDLSAENRGHLNRIAEILGMEPGRLVRDLGKRGSAERIYETLGQLMTKSKDKGAKALLAEMEAGRFTVGDLEAIGKTFNGPDALPWHEAMFMAAVMDAFKTHAEKWGAAAFHVDAGSFGVQLARTLKGVQSMLLLGYNPGYLINNVANNEATMAFSGMFNMLSMKDVNSWTERLGWTPERIRDTGLFGETLGGKDAIAKAMQSKGVLGWMQRATQGVSKWSDMEVAGKMEGMQGARGMTSAMMQAWGRFWERGKGFREMSPALKKMIGDSAIAEHVYRAIEGGMNEREIMDALGGRETGLKAQSLMRTAAGKLGMEPADALVMLQKAGVLNVLDALLKKADTPDKKAYAFSQVEKRAQAWIDMVKGREVRNQAEHYATRINAEGENAAFEIIGDAFQKLNETWLDHYDKAGDTASKMNEIGNEYQGKKALLWNEFRRTQLQVWERANADALTSIKGLMDGIGLDSPEARRGIAILGEQFRSWDSTYEFAYREYGDYYEKWKGQFDDLDTIDARMADHDALKKRVDAKFQEAFKVEEVKQGQFRDWLVEQMRLHYGEAVADAARRAYQQTMDFRKEMVGVLQKFRKDVENLHGADREAAKAKFYKDTYQPRIVEAQRIFEEGAAKVKDVMNGRGTGDEGTGTPVTPPPTPPHLGTNGEGKVTPENVASVPVMVTRGMRQQLYDNGYTKAQVDQMTPTQAWDVINSGKTVRASETPPPPPPRMGTFGEGSRNVWKIASENGMSGLDANGNMLFGAKLDVIKFVKKWGGGEGGKIVRFDDITPELMQKAVDSKKAWQDAQMALPKIDQSQVEGLKSESEALPEPKKGAEDASGKALENFEPENEVRADSPYDKMAQKAVREHIADLDPAVRDALQYELSVMRDMVATGEPGQRLFSKGEGFIGATESSYPSWYGPLSKKKADVLFALDALTKGLDKPEQALYRNLKGIASALLNDDAAISERWDWAKAWGLEDEILYRVDRQISDVTGRVLAGAAEGNYEALSRGYAELVEVMVKIPDEVRGEKVRVLDENGKRVPTAETYDEYTSRLFDEMESLYNSGTAEHLNAVAELAMRDAQAKSEMVMTRELLREQLKDAVPDATTEQVDMALDLLDARAETWARLNGRMPAEWYAERVASVVNSEMGNGGLMQEGSPLAPTWYSKAEQTITAKMPNRADAKAITGLLQGAGVKADEIKWTGLDDWLAEQKGPVSKAEVVKFLQENQVRMEEVTKKSLDWKLSLDERKNVTENQVTKFQQYTLPGGENYREVLFTLPKTVTELPPDAIVERPSIGPSKWQVRRGSDILGVGDTPEAATQYALDNLSRFGKENYTSPHWNEPNVLAHVRLDDRVDADGKRVLFVEEVQSDWHQAGREKGYQVDRVIQTRNDITYGDVVNGIGEIQNIKQQIDLIGGAKLKKGKYGYTVLDATGIDALGKTFMEADDAARAYYAKTGQGVEYKQYEIGGKWYHESLIKPENITPRKRGIPQAPFSKTWHEMVMKRVLRMAAEGGYERVGWTTGEQQAARYDLSKQVDVIRYKQANEGSYFVEAIKDGKSIYPETLLRAENLENHFGKEIAQRIVDGVGEGKLTGENLSVGGSGMRGFYDQMLVAYMDKYGKKWGAKVGETKIETGARSDIPTDAIVVQPTEGVERFVVRDGSGKTYGMAHPTREEAVAWLESHRTHAEDVHSIDVTEAMKQSVLYEGQPLFQGAKGGVSFLADGRAIIHAFEGADVSTVVHEIGHIFRRDLGAADLKVAEDWAGVKDGKWTRAAEEKFARGFEEYLAEGKAPTAKLKAVFAKFKEWMVSIYRVITGSAIDVKITDEMRGVFDRMLAEAPPPAPPQPFQGASRMGTFGEGGNGVRIAEMGREAGVELYPQMKAAAQANMLGEFGMKARPDAVQESMLFQMAEPKMPLGGIDEASGYMPEGAMLDEAYAGQIKPLLELMREEAGRQDGGIGASPILTRLSPEAQAGLTSYIKQVVKQDMPSTKLATVRYGEGRRDFAMLNYQKKYGFDKYILDPAIPYQFFMTRTGMNWLIRAVDKPALYANYFRVGRFTSRYERDLPDRLKGKLKIELPFLPEWMGGAVYIDPMKQLFAPAMFMQPFEQMQKDKNAQVIEAERVLQEWAQDETYSVDEVTQAAQTRAGSVWEAALAEASIRRKAEIASPLDFISMLMSPAYYLTMPYQLATGKGEELSQLPLTRTAQAVETATQGTWAEPLGKAAGLFAKPEQWLREKAGLPEYGQYGEYYVKRQIANLVAEGLATPEEGTMAIYEMKGPVYDQAVERVRQELMMRVPLASSLYAGLHEGPAAAAATLPSSLFGAGILPEGDLKYRGLFEKWNAVWDSRDALLQKFGGDEAQMKAYLQEHPEEDQLTRFFDDHPEYETYLLSKKEDPESQLKKFLTAQIWDSYMGLTKANRKIVTAQLGAEFQHAFLNSETRSPDSLSMETLARWSVMLGNKVPDVAPSPPSPLPITGEGGNVPMLEGLPTRTVGPLEGYDQAKAEQFPNISEMQNLYFSSSDADRARILAIYPEIRQYWDWRRQYIEAHPEVAPFVNRDTAEGILNGTLSAWDYGMSPDQAERLITYYNTEFQTPVYTADYYLEDASDLLREALSAHQLMGTTIGEGSYKELHMIWESFGKPGDSFDDWMENVIYPTLGY